MLIISRVVQTSPIPSTMAASLLAKTGRPVAGSHRRSVVVVAVAQPERRRGIGLSLLSSVLATPAAQAASDFSIKIRDGTATGFPDLPSLPAAPQLQVPGDAAALFADNPLLVFGGAALLAVPLLYSAVSGRPPGRQGSQGDQRGTRDRGARRGRKGGLRRPAGAAGDQGERQPGPPQRAEEGDRAAVRQGEARTGLSE